MPMSPDDLIKQKDEHKKIEMTAALQLLYASIDEELVKAEPQANRYEITIRNGLSKQLSKDPNVAEAVQKAYESLGWRVQIVKQEHMAGQAIHKIFLKDAKLQS